MAGDLIMSNSAQLKLGFINHSHIPRNSIVLRLRNQLEKKNSPSFAFSMSVRLMTHFNMMLCSFCLKMGSNYLTKSENLFHNQSFLIIYSHLTLGNIEIYTHRNAYFAILLVSKKTSTEDCISSLNYLV